MNSSYSSLGDSSGRSTFKISNPLSCCFPKPDNEQDDQEGETLVGSFNGHNVSEEDPELAKQMIIGEAWQVKTEAIALLKAQAKKRHQIEQEIQKTSDSVKKRELEYLLKTTDNEAKEIAKYINWATWRYAFLIATPEDQKEMKKGKPGLYQSHSWTLEEIQYDWAIAKEELTAPKLPALSPEKNSDSQNIKKEEIKASLHRPAKNVTFSDEQQDKGISHIFRDVGDS